MKSSGEEFKNAIDKAFTTQPNVKLNTDTIKDAVKYKTQKTMLKLNLIRYKASRTR